MSTPISYTMTNESITVVVSGKSHTVQKGTANFNGLRQALFDCDWASVPSYLTVAHGIEKWAKGHFKVEGGKVYYKGEALPEDLNQRILEMATKGEDPTCMMRFWERLQANPSYRSVTQLYPFLKHEGIPFTEDGCFLAYKSVRRDYRDHHSGTVDNSPGQKLEMPRNKISDDPKTPCHYGYHVGALAYAQGFGDSGNRRLVVCKVDPADVVCIPYDSNQEKMRVCRYEVIGNYGAQLPSTTFKDEVATPTAAPAAKADGKAKAGKGKAKPEAKSKVKAKDSTVKPATPSALYPDFSAMDWDVLLEQTVEDLRSYACHGLKVVGAGKIPGGKRALVERILEIREGR